MSLMRWILYKLILSGLLLVCHGNLSQFYQMIKKLGGVDPTTLLSYGCYCGWGNSGTNKVIDCLDMCCYHHDHCYEDLSRCSVNYVFTSYEFDKQTMICDAAQSTCKLKLCQCDYNFGICVGKQKVWEKQECRNVKDTAVCRPSDNYTLPACDDIEQVPESLFHDAAVCRNFNVIQPIPGKTTPKTTNNHSITISSEHNTPRTLDVPHSSTVTNIILMEQTSNQSNRIPPLGKLLATCFLTLLLTPVLLA